MPKSRRAQLHLRFGAWVETLPALEEFVEIVAYHLEQACKHSGVGRSDAPAPIERAVEALMAAAEKAERREGILEADRFYARALELLGDAESEQALEARLASGRPADPRAGAKALELLETTADEARQAGST
jgi:predicted ATPase